MLMCMRTTLNLDTEFLDKAASAPADWRDLEVLRADYGRCGDAAFPNAPSTRSTYIIAAGGAGSLGSPAFASGIFTSR